MDLREAFRGMRFARLPGVPAGVPRPTVASGLWSVAGVPHRGWTVDDVEDLGRGETQRCEMCDARDIRYVHWMVHPAYPVRVAAGCDCAEHMSEGYQGERLERELVNRAKRRLNWVRRQWRPTAKGHQKLKADGILFVVCHEARGWVALMKRPGEASLTGGRRTFVTDDAAKLALFDHVWPPRIRP